MLSVVVAEDEETPKDDDEVGEGDQDGRHGGGADKMRYVSAPVAFAAGVRCRALRLFGCEGDALDAKQASPDATAGSTGPVW